MKRLQLFTTYLLLMVFGILFLNRDSFAQTRYWISPASVRADFWDMFNDGADWDGLKQKIDVFSIHVNALDNRVDTNKVKKAVQELKSANIKINFECGGLRPFSGCDDRAGENHAASELVNLNKWLKLGGAIDFITMDSPINTMIKGGDASGTCDWTVEHAANEMVDYMKAVRLVLPNVIFALVEPVPWYRVGNYQNHPGNNYGDLLKVLDTVFTVVESRGEMIEIFHTDSPCEYSENQQTQGWKKIKAVEDFLHARGLRHGRINNSQEGGFQSDQLFYERTLDSWNKYTAVGGNPDEIEVWCWYAHPTANFPETQPYTFSYTCNKFIELVENNKVQNTGALLEPSDGRVYHGAQLMTYETGPDPLAGYLGALNDTTIQPAVRGIFLSIPGTRGPDKMFKGLFDFFKSADSIGFLPELSLFLVSDVATDSVIAVSSQYDWIIDSIVTLTKNYGKSIFLRIGGEFNGKGEGWNGGGYHPYYYVTMFRKITDMFAVKGLRDSIATIWCYEPAAANDFDSVDTKGALWYPGDNYVDWFGLDVFDITDFDQSLPDSTGRLITKKGRSERFLAMSRSKGKPVYMSETSAKSINISSDYNDGVNDWNNWFVKFWDFIDVHKEIKGFSYINANWPTDAYPGWGDARIQNSQYVTGKYKEEMKKPKYIHLKQAAVIPDELPEKVILLSPANQEEITSDRVNLIWHKSNPNVTNYRLEVAFDNRFRSPYLIDSSLTDTIKLVGGLNAGNNYFWRVQAKNATGWGPVSDVWVFTKKDTVLPSTVANIIINPDKTYQTMEGWGASSNFFEEDIAQMSEQTREEAFDLVYKDLGFNILCIRLYSDFQTSKGGAYNWDIMATQRMIINEALSRGNIDFIWLKISSPPGWMKDNNSSDSGGHVKPEHYQDYADYLSYYISHMKSDYGITINAVSIFNEPGFKADYESTETTAKEYKDILKVVAQTFQGNGLTDVWLIGPETGHIKPNKSYFTELMNDPIAKSALSRFTSHQYGDQLMLYGTGDPDNWEWLDSLATANDKKVWETEVFVGGAALGHDNIDEGLCAAQLMWNAVANGNVTAWHYWQYIQPQSQTSSPGILATDRDNKYIVNPRYYCMKHWGVNVKRGDIRIEADCDNKDLKVLAFKKDEKVKIIAFNQTENDINASFICESIFARVEHIRTSSDENYQEQAGIYSTSYNDKEKFDIKIKTKSISTFLYYAYEVSVKENTPKNKSLHVYPNPSSDIIKVSFQLKKAANIRLSLYNQLGKEVALLAAGIKEAGEYSLNIPLKNYNIPSGVYYLRLVSEGFSEVKMLQVVK